MLEWLLIIQSRHSVAKKTLVRAIVRKCYYAQSLSAWKSQRENDCVKSILIFKHDFGVGKTKKPRDARFLRGIT